MIDYIKGKLTYIHIHYAVIEANGVGYQIQMGNPFQLQPYENKETQIYTYQYVREDALALYGFITREERMLFEKLLQVSGIGPKGALAIISAAAPGQIIYAIQSEDVAYLTKFPGIGKKTAQRVILDLKDKLDDLVIHFAHDIQYFQPHSDTMKTSKQAKTLNIPNHLQEAIEALKALGYTDKEVDKILPELKEKAEEEWSTDQYLKYGLQLLMK